MAEYQVSPGIICTQELASENPRFGGGCQVALTKGTVIEQPGWTNITTDNPDDMTTPFVLTKKKKKKKKKNYAIFVSHLLQRYHGRSWFSKLWLWN